MIHLKPTAYKKNIRKMTYQPFSDRVATQYQTWSYPEPVFDIPGWLVDNWQWFDPSHAHRLLWLNRPGFAGGILV